MQTIQSPNRQSKRKPKTVSANKIQNPGKAWQDAKQRFLSKPIEVPLGGKKHAGQVAIIERRDLQHCHPVIFKTRNGRAVERHYLSVGQFKWHCIDRGSGSNTRLYAATNFKTNDGNYTVLLMHRLIANAPLKLCVDHLDFNGLNNLRDNLQLVTNADNVRRQRIRCGGKSSQFKGVSFDSQGNRWVASFMRTYAGKPFTQCLRFPGSEKGERQAAAAYDHGQLLLNPNHCYLNQETYPDIADLRLPIPVKGRIERAILRLHERIAGFKDSLRSE